MRFEVSMAVKMRVVVFCVMIPCGWLPIFQRNILPPSSTLVVKVIGSSKMLVTTYLHMAET
jgi:hypothetical protein